jgi:hypothetical protein
MVAIITNWESPGTLRTVFGQKVRERTKDTIKCYALENTRCGITAVRDFVVMPFCRLR